MTKSLKLSKRGDVLLKVGKGESIVQLEVSSATMSEASPVFAAMFNGRFLEGQELSLHAPREILLPDDNAVPMQVLCKIIHFQAEDVAATITLDGLADFAVVCDKYDCTRAALPWSKLWVRQFITDSRANGTEKLLFATYALDLPEEFRDVTKTLIRARDTAIDSEIASHGVGILPDKFLQDLQLAWYRSQNQSLAALQPNVLFETFRFSSCLSLKDMTGAWFKCLVLAELAPIRPRALQDCKIRVQKFQSNELNKHYNPCKKYQCTCRKGAQLQTQAMNDINAIFDGVQGFCLDCVRKNAVHVQDRTCRVAHD